MSSGRSSGLDIDSLAEVHLTLVDRETAIASFEKALQVDPDVANASQMLERIKTTP